MDSPEFDEILAQLQAMVRRAYSLGRSEALKRVVAVMEKDEANWAPLAIKGPSEAASSASIGTPQPGTLPKQETHVETGTDTVGNTPTGEDLPWWQRSRAPTRRTATR